MSQLECNPCEYAPHRFVLVAIMTTFCIENRNDFLVWDTTANAMAIWGGTAMIRHFWCAPELPIDTAKFVQERNAFFDHRSLVYDRSRMTPKNIHDPSNRAHPDYAPDYVDKVYLEWTIRRGPFNREGVHPDSLLPPGRRATVERFRRAATQEGGLFAAVNSLGAGSGKNQEYPITLDGAGDLGAGDDAGLGTRALGAVPRGGLGTGASNVSTVAAVSAAENGADGRIAAAETTDTAAVVAAAAPADPTAPAAPTAPATAAAAGAAAGTAPKRSLRLQSDSAAKKRVPLEPAIEEQPPKKRGTVASAAKLSKVQEDLRDMRNKVLTSEKALTMANARILTQQQQLRQQPQPQRPQPPQQQQQQQQNQQLSQRPRPKPLPPPPPPPDLMGLLSSSGFHGLMSTFAKAIAPAIRPPRESYDEQLARELKEEEQKKKHAIDLATVQRDKERGVSDQRHMMMTDYSDSRTRSMMTELSQAAFQQKMQTHHISESEKSNQHQRNREESQDFYNLASLNRRPTIGQLNLSMPSLYPMQSQTAMSHAAYPMQPQAAMSHPAYPMQPRTTVQTVASSEPVMDASAVSAEKLQQMAEEYKGMLAEYAVKHAEWKEAQEGSD
jgi:hypothetical protein